MLPWVSSGGALTSLLSLSFSASWSSFTVLKITCFLLFLSRKIGVQEIKGLSGLEGKVAGRRPTSSQASHVAQMQAQRSRKEASYEGPAWETCS